MPQFEFNLLHLDGTYLYFSTCILILLTLFYYWFLSYPILNSKLKKLYNLKYSIKNL